MLDDEKKRAIHHFLHRYGPPSPPGGPPVLNDEMEDAILELVRKILPPPPEGGRPELDGEMVVTILALARRFACPLALLMPGRRPALADELWDALFAMMPQLSPGSPLRGWSTLDSEKQDAILD